MRPTRVRFTRLLTLTALTAFAAACASTAPPVVTPKLKLQRVVVAPLNLAVHPPEELLGQQEPIWRELVQFLQTQNQSVTVLEQARASLLWEDTLADMVRSDTPPALDAALASFSRRLAGEAPYDVLVIPSLVLRRARVEGRTASWDGVERPLPLLSPAEYESIDVGPFAVSKRGFEGSVTAASLHVRLLDPNGQTVMDGLGGLSVIQEADREREGRPWSLALRESPFEVPDQVREGIARAFEEQLRVPTAAR